MSKFKVGDVVERAGRDSNIGLDFTATDAGPYVVTSTTTGGWIQINGYKGYDGYNTHPFEDTKFKLVEQDDPLPPVPKSVRYNEGTGGFAFEVKSLVENAYHPNRIRLGVLCGDREITHKYVVIDPDAALQLAHDLNRMANEIKRRERAQSGE